MPSKHTTEVAGNIFFDLRVLGVHSSPTTTTPQASHFLYADGHLQVRLEFHLVSTTCCDRVYLPLGIPVLANCDQVRRARAAPFQGTIADQSCNLTRPRTYFVTVYYAIDETYTNYVVQETELPLCSERRRWRHIPEHTIPAECSLIMRRR